METQLEAERWSAGELEEKIQSVKPAVAVFDCDGTLWRIDSGVGFMEWSIEQGLVSRSTSDWIDTRYRAYRAGDVSEIEICGAMVQIYAGLREEELRRAAAEYVREFVRPSVFAEMARLVAGLRQSGENGSGAELWAVSSTNKWVVAEGVREFGIPAHRVLAADVALAGGVLSSELTDVPTDEGKATALRRAGVMRPDAVFGNSIHDLAMLEMAAHPFPVNPSAELLEVLAARGWGYFLPGSVERDSVALAGK
jgi:phosphoserine phosphatase